MLKFVLVKKAKVKPDPSAIAFNQHKELSLFSKYKKISIFNSQEHYNSTGFILFT